MKSSIGNIEIGRVLVGALPIAAIYVGANLVWELESVQPGSSCFSSGHWIDELPWVDTEIWVD